MGACRPWQCHFCRGGTRACSLAAASASSPYFFASCSSSRSSCPAYLLSAAATLPSLTFSGLCTLYRADSTRRQLLDANAAASAVGGDDDGAAGVGADAAAAAAAAATAGNDDDEDGDDDDDDDDDDADDAADDAADDDSPLPLSAGSRVGRAVAAFFAAADRPSLSSLFFCLSACAFFTCAAFSAARPTESRFSILKGFLALSCAPEDIANCPAFFCVLTCAFSHACTFPDVLFDVRLAPSPDLLVPIFPRRCMMAEAGVFELRWKPPPENRAWCAFIFTGCDNKSVVVVCGVLSRVETTNNNCRASLRSRCARNSRGGALGAAACRRTARTLVAMQPVVQV